MRVDSINLSKSFYDVNHKYIYRIVFQNGTCKEWRYVGYLNWAFFQPNSLFRSRTPTPTCNVLIHHYPTPKSMDARRQPFITEKISGIWYSEKKESKTLVPFSTNNFLILFTWAAIVSSIPSLFSTYFWVYYDCKHAGEMGDMPDLQINHLVISIPL